MRPLWPHQDRGLAETIAAIEAGERRVCVTSPTGGGKSEMMVRLILWAVERAWPVVLYTHRRMLFDQIGRTLSAAGIDHGKRASGHESATLRNVQLAMIQTEESQVYKAESRELHGALLVIIDEAHVLGGATAEKIIDAHHEQGAAIVGFTATPLGIGHVYEKLIVAGVTSELRDCGALVPCHTYAPDEPDTRKLKRQPSGEYTENDVRKVIMSTTIFARVFDWWRRLNPDARPTLLFAPGVAESTWFAQQFEERGVRAAHIDGEEIYLDGEVHKSSPEMRDEVKRLNESGDVPVVCNRFVLREGIDWPHLHHGIFATIFGGVASYIQSGGRLLRAHPSLDHVVLQDHGGNWWRHGSLNSDREWDLTLDNHAVSATREDRIREKKEREPLVCPKCARTRLPRGGQDNLECPFCGYRVPKKTRMVVQIDGSLKEMRGDILRARRRMEPSERVENEWKRYYFRGRRSGMTFAQIEALYAMEHDWRWPPRGLPNMPAADVDWFRNVNSVGRAALIPERVKQPEPSLFP